MEQYTQVEYRSDKHTYRPVTVVEYSTEQIDTPMDQYIVVEYKSDKRTYGPVHTSGVQSR